MVVVAGVAEPVDWVDAAVLLMKERIDSWNDLALEGVKYPGEAVEEVTAA